MKNIGRGRKQNKMVKGMKERFLVREIEIPHGLEIEIKDNEILAREEGREIKRKFKRVLIEKEENKIIIKIEGATKHEKKQINTTVAHIKNMLKGIEEKFVYKLQICSVHFPINVSVKEDSVVIKNFLGEARERKAKIMPNVNVKIEKEIITLESEDKEAAGQTAANIEKTTKIKKRDIRVFQDGIYIIEKPGRTML